MNVHFRVILNVIRMCGCCNLRAALNIIRIWDNLLGFSGSRCPSPIIGNACNADSRLVNLIEVTLVCEVAYSNLLRLLLLLMLQIWKLRVGHEA